MIRQVTCAGIVDHEVLTHCHSGHGWCQYNLCRTSGKGGWSSLSTTRLCEMACLMSQPLPMTAAASSDTVTMLSMTMRCGGSLVLTACCRMLPLTLATSTDITFGGWQYVHLALQGECRWWCSPQVWQATPCMRRPRTAKYSNCGLPAVVQSVHVPVVPVVHVPIDGHFVLALGGWCDLHFVCFTCGWLQAQTCITLMTCM